MGGDGDTVAAVVGGVVDHENVDLEVASVPFERRQAALEVPAGVVVDDDDGEFRRSEQRPVGHLMRRLRDQDDPEHDARHPRPSERRDLLIAG